MDEKDLLEKILSENTPLQRLIMRHTTIRIEFGENHPYTRYIEETIINIMYELWWRSIQVV